MKKVLKALIARILGWQVRRLRRRSQFQVVAVVGSIGKTSTKLAIAKLLGSHFRVQYQEGNYNDLVSVPLVFFGKPLPKLMNPFAWIKTLVAIEFQLHRPYRHDVVVLELGTDGPGQIAKFENYLEVDLLVVTAITPEHMEFFTDLSAVAKEELSAETFSKRTLVNKDLCAPEHLQFLDKDYLTYALKQPADYKLEVNNFTGARYGFTFKVQGKTAFNSSYDGISELELYSVCAATTVAHQIKMPVAKIPTAIRNIKTFSGRMKQLIGMNDSLIIDDTYNASPTAAKAALDALYALGSPQKIVLLGNMNELGDYSKEAHIEVGEYCDPKEIDMLVTIGKDANQYLAEAAKKRGCKVKTFNDPYQAGLYIKDMLRPKAIVLAKGSQNGVYAEEAVKQFLANKKDAAKLVRQTPEWLRKKAESFGKAA